MRHAIFAGDGEIRLARSADPVAGEGEAILQVGLLGATGRLDVDDVRVTGTPR